MNRVLFKLHAECREFKSRNTQKSLVQLNFELKMITITYCKYFILLMRTIKTLRVNCITNSLKSRTSFFNNKIIRLLTKWKIGLCTIYLRRWEDIKVIKCTIIKYGNFTFITSNYCLKTCLFHTTN